MRKNNGLSRIAAGSYSKKIAYDVFQEMYRGMNQPSRSHGYFHCQATNPYTPYLQAVISYEKRDKKECLAALGEIGLGPEKLHQMYLDAISFAESVLG